MCLRLAPGMRRWKRTSFQRIRNTLCSGQSYKHFTLVNYNLRVVIWGIFQGSNPGFKSWRCTYTGWTFFTLICGKNCIVCLKRPKNEKEARVGPLDKERDRTEQKGFKRIKKKGPKSVSKIRLK